MTNKNAVIQVSHLSQTFDMKTYQVHALKDISFDVFPGEFIGLIGPSGSGKTTLINCLSGLLIPSSGEIKYGKEDIAKFSLSKRRKFRLNSLGLVFQEHLLVKSLTAFENIELPLIFGRISIEERKPRVLNLLNQVKLEDKGSHLPEELSGGEQQRVGIARALAFNPNIILADEPTGDLDTRNSQQIIHIFRELVKERNISIVMVSHDPRHRQYFDRVLEISDGYLSI